MKESKQKQGRTESGFLGMSVHAHPSCLHMHTQTTNMHTHASSMHTYTRPETQDRKRNKARKLTTYHAYNMNIKINLG